MVKLPPHLEVAFSYWDQFVVEQYDTAKLELLVKMLYAIASNQTNLYQGYYLSLVTSLQTGKIQQDTIFAVFAVEEFVRDCDQYGEQVSVKARLLLEVLRTLLDLPL